MKKGIVLTLFGLWLTAFAVLPVPTLTLTLLGACWPRRS